MEKPMTKLIESLETALPRAQAFAYIADWSRQAEWDPNTVSAKRIGEGEPAVGARYALEVKMGRKAVPMEYRITELEAPSRIVLIGEGSGVWTEDAITFTETATGTSVDYQAEIKLSGILGLAQPVLGRAFAGIARGAVEGMKRELDARVVAPEAAPSV
jgi:dehydrogenase/reductase SDR family protein 12